MSKQETIEVDTKKLREVAIKNNENSISKLTDAIDKISDVKIPDDFEYKTELELLPNRIAGLQDTISDINRYIDKKAGEYDALQGKTLNWAPSYQGGVISPTGYTGYSTTTPEEREEQWRRLGATIFNIFGGFSEGATEMFIDGGTKAFDLAGGVCATPAWALIDIVKNGVTGGKANSHLLSDNWSDLMDRLASPGDLELQHQSEHEREESKRIDELAYGPFKYGGEGYKTIKGAGSVMGMIFGPGVAAGGATGATAGTSKVVSAISTFFTSTSRGATEYFTDKKNNSMDGIEEAYKSGDITKEEYETIKSIRNMSDEDWTKYENQVKNLSPQDPKYKDYTNIKKIREMPEEWKTLPNAVKGLTYGVGAGAWETGQYLLGLKMMNTNMSPSVRTLTNTVLNGLDPVVRAGSQATLDGTSFAENFEKQGGWGAVGRGIVIGGGLSALGEVVNYSSRRKATNSTTKTDIYLVQTDDGKVIGLLEEPPNASRCIKTYVEHPSDITVQEALNTGNYSLEQDLIDIANYNRQNRNYTSVIQDDVPGDIIDVDYDLSTNTYKAKSEIKYPLLTTNNNNSQTYPVSLYNDDLNLRIGINKPNPSNYYPSNLYFPNTRLNPYNGLKIPETGAHIANSTTVTAPITLSTRNDVSTKVTTQKEIKKDNNNTQRNDVSTKSTTQKEIKKDNNNTQRNDVSTKVTTQKEIKKDNNNNTHNAVPYTGTYMDRKIRKDMHYDKSTYAATQYSQLDYDFEYNKRAIGSYGINQGIIDTMYWWEYVDKKKYGTDRLYYNSKGYREAISNKIPIQKVGNKEYFELKHVLVSKYGIVDDWTASTVLSSIDSNGACSYAAVANDIISHYRNDPQLFERLFGISLYREVNGVKVFNDVEILADIFIYTNCNKINGRKENDKLLYKDSSGKIYINDSAIDRNKYGKGSIVGEQKYFSGENWLDDDLINDYLSYKRSGTYCKIGLLNYQNVNNVVMNGKSIRWGSGFSEKEMKDIIVQADRMLREGAELQLVISCTDKNIRFYDLDNGGTLLISTNNWDEGDSHATKITGMCKDGFIVSTWGKRCMITFDDLQRSGAFNVSYTKYYKKNNQGFFIPGDL